MRFLLALLLILFPPLALAESRSATVPTNAGTILLTLHDAQCSRPDVLVHIPQEIHDQFQNADIILGETKLLACWSATISRNRPLEHGHVFLIDEQDNAGQVSLAHFKGTGI